MTLPDDSPHANVPGSIERVRQDDDDHGGAHAHVYTLSGDPSITNENDNKSRGNHSHHSHHHASNSDHFRRLEDRMDELQQQMVATQRMIHDVAETMKRQARETREPRETRAAAVRQNFRVLSGRAMATMLAPTVAPTTSSSVASSMDTSSAAASRTLRSAVAGDDSPKTNHDDQPTAPPDDTFPDAHDQYPRDGDGAVVEAPGYRKSSHLGGAASGTRKLSVTNPVSLSGERAVTRPSMALAVAHAAAFVVEASKAASAKKVRPMVLVGPIMSRRFSISSLNLGIHTGEGGFVARAMQWTRGVFRKTRVEPTKATADEIQTARSGHERLHPLTIHHDSLQRTVWDTIVMLMIIVDVVLTPLSLSFQFYPPGINEYNVLGNCVFALDFLVNMLSSYTTPRGVLVFGPRNTIRHYLLSVWWLPDLLSWFPFETLVSSEQSRFLGVAKVIRLVKVGQLARRFHSSKKAGIFRFIKLLGTVFIVSHCMSCYWNWVAKEWRMQEDGYLQFTMGQQYAHCWSIVIGSLNASPPTMYTTQEEISVAFFMLIGNVLQATVFGSVAVLISSFDEEEVAYNKKLISTYERCRFLDIPEKLARRIQGYYENLYQETRSVSPDADAFINELSPALICEVKFQLYRDMITQIPFLSASQINPVVIEMLILHLRTVIYMQDDVLIRKGEFGDWMGFIGSKGSVGVLDPNSETRRIIRILKKGDYFGEMALLQRSKRSTTAIALSWVQIHVLCRNDLDDVKEQYPEQAEILEEEIIKYMKAKVTYK